MNGDQVLRLWYLFCGIVILLCAFHFDNGWLVAMLVGLGVTAVSVATYWEETRRL